MKVLFNNFENKYFLTKAIQGSIEAIVPTATSLSTNEANTSSGIAGMSSVYGASPEH